jgi:hypothetical protein
MMGHYMVVFGGYTGPNTVNSDRVTIAVSPDHPVQMDHILALDTEKLSWVRPNNIGKMPLSRYGHVAVEAGTQLIVFAGWGSNRALNDICVVEAFGSIADSVNMVDATQQSSSQENHTGGDSGQVDTREYKDDETKGQE